MNKKFIAIAIVVLIIVGLVYYNRNKLFKKSEKPNPDANKLPLNNGFNVQVPDLSNDNFPLNKGSKGQRVKNLQLALNKLNEKQGSKNDPLVPDGIFGEKTTNLLMLVAGIGYYGTSGVTEQQYDNLILLSNK